jgi:hypothetical protein
MKSDCIYLALACGQKFSKIPLAIAINNIYNIRIQAVRFFGGLPLLASQP